MTKWISKEKMKNLFKTLVEDEAKRTSSSSSLFYSKMLLHEQRFDTSTLYLGAITWKIAIDSHTLVECMKLRHATDFRKATHTLDA
uniref:Uncharacterized protein n=1 Tax=Glossina pallidipes TaxID=7398 RepID=A0A1A9ZFN5_GLOPL